MSIPTLPWQETRCLPNPSTSDVTTAADKATGGRRGAPCLAILVTTIVPRPSRPGSRVFRTALFSWNSRWTRHSPNSHRELDEHADAVRDFLTARGMSSGGTVAVTGARSEHAYPAILGTLKAGCAYVPVKAADPASRIEFILGDSEADAMLALEAETERFDQPFHTLTVRGVLDTHGAPRNGWENCHESPPADRDAAAGLASATSTSSSPRPEAVCRLPS